MKQPFQPIVEWLGTTPRGWTQPRLKGVFQDKSGAISMEQLTELEVQHYSIPNFDEFGTPAREDGATIASNKTLLHGGEILFSKLNCHKPRVWLVPHDAHVKVASTEFIPLAEWQSGSVDKRFFIYLLGSAAFAEYMTCFQTSVTNSHRRINPNDLWQTRVPLPLLPEQQRIAAYLDASCAAIDAAVNAKRRQLEILDALRRSNMHVLFADHSDATNERVKDVAAKITSGVTPDGGSAGYLDSGIPLLRSQNVHFDGLRLDDVAYISADTHAAMSGSQVKPRDVLLNITGASIGRCTFVPDGFGEGNVNQHVCVIRPGPRVDHRFLAAFLSSPVGQGQILSTFTGASRQGLSHSDLGLIRIPFPTISVQREIVGKIESHDLIQRRLCGCIETQVATLSAYRKSLIHECVIGQRRITEADINRVRAHG
jgi:type I restriction enzyme S subunit